MPNLEPPKRKDEPFRRTDLSYLFAASLDTPSSTLSAALAERLAPLKEQQRLVFVDGVYRADLSDTSALPPGVVAASYADANLPPSAEADIARALLALPEAELELPRKALGCLPFATLNQAALSDAACVYLPAGVELAESLHLVSISTGSAGDSSALAASHPNAIVWLEPNSKLSLVHEYAGEGDYFTNALTRCRVGAGASLAHAYLQEQSPSAVHVDSVVATLGEDAEYDAQFMQWGGRISRVNLDLEFAAPGGHADIDGLALGSGSQLLDLHSTLKHNAPRCTSNQRQRNAASGRSRIVFRGAVDIPSGSDVSVAHQLCRSLLLSNRARVDVAPTLEIGTDEVECTHGATVSDLDDEMIFYLQSRGLGRDGARQLLLEGWARESMQKVPSDDARNRVVAKAAELAAEIRDDPARSGRRYASI